MAAPNTCGRGFIAKTIREMQRDKAYINEKGERKMSRVSLCKANRAMGVIDEKIPSWYCNNKKACSCPKGGAISQVGNQAGQGVNDTK